MSENENEVTRVELHDFIRRALEGGWSIDELHGELDEAAADVEEES